MPSSVTVIGAVQGEPELRFTATGLPVVNFSVRVTSKPQKGDPRHEYFDVTAWRALGEHVAETLRDKDRVIVVGRLQQQTWESDGQKKSKVGITADAVGPSLEFSSAAVDRTERSGSPAQASIPDF